ncbi:MAG: transposase [Candidatus Syntropharchaeales archaeon]
MCQVEAHHQAEAESSDANRYKERSLKTRFGEMSLKKPQLIAKELDDSVEQFLKRPIECEIRYLFIDAAYFKVREDV